MYIHGYGSNGNATKGQLLRTMLPECCVVSPTFDYDHRTPYEIQQQIRDVVAQEDVRMIVGSSFGGYHALCATSFFQGPVWVVNPAHDVVQTICRVVLAKGADNFSQAGRAMLECYRQFDSEVFRRQVRRNQEGHWPQSTPLHFALSTDDELLGDHRPLLQLFPRHAQVVWKDNCGHRFFRFEELAADLRASMP